MNRLFTFGCSYTQYKWSTWANILSRQAKHFQNWGKLGGGNHFIFNSIFECHQRNQFTSSDTVIVCWTNTVREDRYSNQQWHCPGNIYTAPHGYPKDWVMKYIDERGCILRDLAFISAVKIFLKHIGLDWHFLSMVPLKQLDQYKTNVDSNNTDLFDLYSDVLTTIKQSFVEALPDRVLCGFDLHHTPREHLTYLDRVLPQYVIDDQTRLLIEQEDYKVRNKLPYDKPDQGTVLRA